MSLPSKKVTVFTFLGALLALSVTSCALLFNRENSFGPVETRRHGSPTLITQQGRDGLGHQLWGMYTCMLLPLVDNRYRYVKKSFTGVSHTKSKMVRKLFAAIQDGFPEATSATVEKHDNCWSQVAAACDSYKDACVHARILLARTWRSKIAAFVSNHTQYAMQNDTHIMIHLRGNDVLKFKPQTLLTGLAEYPYLIKFLSYKKKFNHRVPC